MKIYSPQVIGTLSVTGSAVVTGSLGVTGSIEVRSGSFNGTVVDNLTTPTASDAVQHVVSISAVDYGAIAVPDPNTFYIINDAAGALILGPTIVTGSLTVTGSVISTIGFTGSLLGTASFATNAATATTASFYSLAGVTQNAVFSGSVRGEVNVLSIASSTASLNCALDNFFTLTLVSGSTTFINPSNIQPGQTINLRITQPSVSFGSVSFPSSVKQVSGSSYTPTAVANAQDIVTFISFDSTNLYLSNVKNLI